MKLWVLTACTRPENLNDVWYSIYTSKRRTHVQLRWLIRYDRAGEHIGGQHLKNEMLGDVDDGWVWVCDDDTIAHPEFIPRLVREENGWDAIVVSQLRADGRVLGASPENVRVGGIDIGQVALRRELVGDHRIPIDYNGDGMFLERVLAGANVLFIDEELSYHNKLRPGTA